MPTSIERFSTALLENSKSFGVHLPKDDVARLGHYYTLLLKWNPRFHLVAPCSPEVFATRHVLESLLLIKYLSRGSRVVDVGSGAGLPIIPCLIVRKDLRVTLIESSQRKLAFLREALRSIDCETPANLIGRRFEQVSPPEADFITCRALDRFQAVLPRLSDWAPANSTLLLFAGDALCEQIETIFPMVKAERIPLSKRRFLIIAARNELR